MGRPPAKIATVPATVAETEITASLRQRPAAPKPSRSAGGAIHT
jgi:hypothetical protein